MLRVQSMHRRQFTFTYPCNHRGQSKQNHLRLQPCRVHQQQHVYHRTPHLLARFSSGAPTNSTTSITHKPILPPPHSHDQSGLNSENSLPSDHSTGAITSSVFVRLGELFPKPVRGIVNYRDRLLQRVFPNKFSLNGRVEAAPWQRTKFLLSEIMIVGISALPSDPAVIPLYIWLVPRLPSQYLDSCLLLYSFSFHSAVMAASLLLYLGGIVAVRRFIPSAAIVPNPQLVSLQPVNRYRRNWIRWLAGVGLLFAWWYDLRSETEKVNPMDTIFLTEEPTTIEYGMDCTNSGWSLPFAAAPMTIISPLLEELIFRGLLFARCARMFGIPIGFVTSSVIFGAMHGSSKAIQTARMGGEFGGLYAVSHSLGLTSLMHMVQNTNCMTVNSKINPMAPFEDQCQHQVEMDALTVNLDYRYQSKMKMLSRGLYVEDEWEAKLPDIICRLFQSVLDLWNRTTAIQQRQDQMKGYMTQVFENDLKTLKPEMSAAVKQLFHLLDTDQKGYLNVSEFGYFHSSHPCQSAYLHLANRIIQRRTSQTVLQGDGGLERLLGGLDVRNRFFQVEPLSLPHELITHTSTHPPTPLFGVTQTLLESQDNYLPHQLASLSTILRHMPTHLPGVDLHLHPFVDFSRPGADVFGTLLASYGGHRVSVDHWRLPCTDLKSQATIRQLIPMLQQQLSTSTVTDRSISLQYFRNWYSLHSLMAYQDFFHDGKLRQSKSSIMSEAGPVNWNGCTQEAFEKYLVRQFQLEPVLASQWLERIIRILKNEEQHPVTLILTLSRKK